MDSSVIIGLLARDCQDSLIRNIPKIERLCSFFADYHIVVVENDSTDDTQQMLHDWAERNGRVLVDSFTNNTRRLADCSYNRISMMAYLRNRLLDDIMQLPAPDLVIMMDVDIYDFDVEGVIDGICHAPEDWGALMANGRLMLPNHQFNRYQYDQYALMGCDEDLSDTIYFQPRRGRSFNTKVQRCDYYPVQSAFGGVGIYRYAAIKEARYQAVMTDDGLQNAFCEHIPFHLEVIQKGYRNYICRRLVVNNGLLNVKLWVAFLMSYFPQVYEMLFYLNQCIRKTQ